MNNQILYSLLSGLIGSFIGIAATIFIYFIDKKRDRINSAKSIYLQLYQAHAKFKESVESSQEVYRKVRQVYLDPNWYYHIIKLNPLISTEQMLELCNYFEQLNNLFKAVKGYELYIEDQNADKALEFKKKALVLSKAILLLNEASYVKDVVTSVKNISESKILTRKEEVIIFLPIFILVVLFIIVA